MEKITCIIIFPIMCVCVRVSVRSLVLKKKGRSLMFKSKFSEVVLTINQRVFKGISYRLPSSFFAAIVSSNTHTFTTCSWMAVYMLHCIRTTWSSTHECFLATVCPRCCNQTYQWSLQVPYNLWSHSSALWQLMPSCLFLSPKFHEIQFSYLW